MSNEDPIKKYGEPGAKLGTLLFPYPMKYMGKPVTRIQVHKDYLESLKNASSEILEKYGIEKIKELGLDQYGGCFNNRVMRGSDTKLSMHAFAAAIDLYPEKNTLKMNSTQALFAKPEYKDFIDIMEKHGWYSLGRAKNYDWMHFQTEKP